MKAMKLCYSITEEPTNLYTDTFITLFKAIKTIIVYKKKSPSQGKRNQTNTQFPWINRIKDFHILLSYLTFQAPLDFDALSPRHKSRQHIYSMEKPQVAEQVKQNQPLWNRVKKNSAPWRQIRRESDTLGLESCFCLPCWVITSDKSLHFLVPQFLLFQNGKNHGTYFKG